MNQVSGFYEQQLGIALQVDFNFVEKNHQSACGLASTPNDPSQVVPFVNKAAECLPNYPAQDLCISMVLTSVEFQETAVGVANVKAICLPGQNTGIASDSGVNGRLTRPEFLSVFMHEIGHLFGSQHDSPGTTCGNVDANQRFVMFPSVQPDSSNKFVFSQCSLSAIQQTLSEPSHQCWKNGGGGGSSLRDSFSSPSLDDTFATPTFSSPSPSIIIDYHHHLH